MDNQAAKLVSEAILGSSFKTVVVGGEAYTLYPPTIRTIARAISHFATVDMQGVETGAEVIARIPASSGALVQGLAVLIVGDGRFRAFREWYVKRRLFRGSCAELKEAMTVAVSLMGAEDFFVSASLASSVARMGANTK
ncbi:MAG: hypothetical protein LBB27_01055 [Tannerellaceae bacterium]|jgi:hypothetical protein|nr:hypothetical protein [Tannerellaceae bacterium]